MRAFTGAIIAVVTLFTSSLAVQAATLGAPAAGTLQLRMATLASDGSSWMKILSQGSAEMETKTQERVTFKWYAGGAQGDEGDMVRKINLGQLNGAALSGVGLSKIDPSIRVLDLPRMFATVEEFDYVSQDVALLPEEVRGQGLPPAGSRAACCQAEDRSAWIDQGELRALKLHRQWRILTGEIDRLLRECRHAG